MSVRKLSTCAMLIAMYIVLSLLSLNLGNMKLTFDGLPIIIGALLFGPVEGALIGFLGSFTNQMLTFGFTPTTILWVLPAAVRGVIVGAYAMRRGFELDAKRLVGVVILSALVVTVLNTVVLYIDSKIYGYYSFVFVFGAVLPRIAAGVLTSLAYCAVLPTLTKRLRKV